MISIIQDSIANLPRSQGTVFQIAWLASKSSFVIAMAKDTEEFRREVEDVLETLQSLKMIKVNQEVVYFMDFGLEYPGTRFCKSTDCGGCQYIVPFSSDSIRLWDDTVKQVQVQADCQTKCIVYAILCEKCGLVYVGKTDGPLWHRLRDHLEKPHACNLHFQKCGKESLRIFVLQRGQHPAELPILELKWQIALGSFWPHGLNFDWKFSWIDDRCQHPIIIDPDSEIDGKLLKAGTMLAVSDGANIPTLIGSRPATVIGNHLVHVKGNTLGDVCGANIGYKIQQACQFQNEVVVFTNLDKIIQQDVKENPPKRAREKNGHLGDYRWLALG